MSEKREMYPELSDCLDTVSDRKIERALEEIASGTGAFGPHDEWIEWYHYLLPRLILRNWNPTYYNPAELLFTAFIAQHPESEGTLPYAKFRKDARDTLGRYIMSPQFWPSGELDAVNCLSKWRGPTGIAGWFDASGLLSASLFFCIKYLASKEVEAWFRSVMAIEDRLWTIQIVTWLTGAYPILAGEMHQPAEFPEIGPIRIRWSWSHVLRGNYTGSFAEPLNRVPFLPAENRVTILQLARGWEVDIFLEDFMTDPETQSVADELTGIPERFLQLYKADGPTA